MSQNQCITGLDVGTDSEVAVHVYANGATTTASQVLRYNRREKGLYCDPAVNQYRQRSSGYIEASATTICEVPTSFGVNEAEEIMHLSRSCWSHSARIFNLTNCCVLEALVSNTCVYYT